MHVRLIVPSDRTGRVLDTLVADARVTSIVQLPGAARRAGQAAPGGPDDAVSWDAVVDQAYGETSESFVY